MLASYRDSFPSSGPVEVGVVQITGCDVQPTAWLIHMLYPQLLHDVRFRRIIFRFQLGKYSSHYARDDRKNQQASISARDKTPECN